MQKKYMTSCSDDMVILFFALRPVLQSCEQFAETHGVVFMLLYPVISLIHSYLMIVLL